MRESRALAPRPVGIDVSHYQLTINWTGVKSCRIAFAWAKATDSATSSGDDAYFTSNASNAKAAGFPIGAYHYAHPDSNTTGEESTSSWL